MVLRNYLAQRAIDQAEQGDYSEVRHILDELKHPYEDTDQSTMDSRKSKETTIVTEDLVSTADVTQKRKKYFSFVSIEKKNLVVILFS